MLRLVIKYAPGRSGTIELRNYTANEQKNWRINSACAEINIMSREFETEAQYDVVTIDGVMYSGSSIINQHILNNSFGVSFTSDNVSAGRGFILDWSCAQTG